MPYVNVVHEWLICCVKWVFALPGRVRRYVLRTIGAVYYMPNSDELCYEALDILQIGTVLLHQQFFVDIDGTVFQCIARWMTRKYRDADAPFTSTEHGERQVASFAKKHQIDIATTRWDRPIGQYHSMNDFFMRRYMNLEVASSSIVYPACACVALFRSIHAIAQPLKGDVALECASGIPAFCDFEQQFCLYCYLSPSDYHCFHSPIDGIVEEVVDLRHLPTCSGSVRPYLTNHQRPLVAYNRRYIIVIRNGCVKMALVILGGFLVDSIRIDCGDIRKGMHLTKGQYLGAFALGGSAILLLSNAEIRHVNPSMFDRPISTKVMACSALGEFVCMT